MASSAAARRALGYAEARKRVLSAAQPLPAEQVPLAEALGRPLHHPFIAPHALPPFRNSAMDGIAVRVSDLSRATSGAPITLRVTETVPAGATAGRPVGAGEAVRIMTGAPMPDGADAVVPVEELGFERSTDGVERVRVNRAATAGENVRDAGLDLKAGATALEAGRAISPHDLALLASLGEARPTVGGRPRVAVITTGDELLSPGEALRPGTIRDSNLPMLAALLGECGARVVSTRHVTDDAGLVSAEVRAGLAQADVVITIGGVSAGDFDPVKQAIAGLEGVELWLVAMRPGRPQAFGAPGGHLFFGLPGNPASVACVFEALVRPALRKLQGFATLERPRVGAQAAVEIPSRTGRTDFVRVTLERRDDAWWARPVGDQVSGHLTPQARAHALLVIPAEADRLILGDRAEAWVLRWPEGNAA